MNNRSTWMTVLGVVLSVACRTGECGRTTLTTDTGVPGRYVVRLVEHMYDPFGQEFGIHVTCRMCHSTSDECTYVPANKVVASGGVSSSVTRGTVVWKLAPGAPPQRPPATLSAEVTCPGLSASYYDRPGGVSMQPREYGGGAGNPTVTVNGPGGVWGAVPAWRDLYPAGWDLKIHADGSGPGATATPVKVSLSYPEVVVLDGRGKEAQVIYDIEGNGELLVVMDGVPAELACVRRSDRVGLHSGLPFALWPGDGISCTNQKVGPGQTNGIIAVTAMIK